LAVAFEALAIQVDNDTDRVPLVRSVGARHLPQLLKAGKGCEVGLALGSVVGSVGEPMFFPSKCVKKPPLLA